MSNDGTRYQVNAPRILAEEISGEVLAIDNHTGAYVSITGSGVAIWNLVVDGYNAEEIAATLATRHATDVDAARGTVSAFVDRLVENALIVGDDRPAPPTLAVSTPPTSTGPEPLGEPKLDRYTDMEDMLLFDPIHDVDEQGWPQIEPGTNRS